MGRVEKGAVDRFLREHRFSDINHVRSVGRWPLSRPCCPLLLAAEKGDVLIVLLLLHQGADPLLPETLSRQREARRLLEWAAGEDGRRLAEESLITWSLYHITDAIARERDEPLFRDLQRSDPLLRRLAQHVA